jgi:hypothetical protein
VVKSGMRVARDKNQLIVMSENAQGCGGVLGVTIGVAIFLLLAKLSRSDASGLGIGLFVGGVFLVAGILFLLPRRITTIFDLPSRQVYRTTTIWKDWGGRTRTVPFSEILSIGYDRPDSSEETYWPALRLANGETLWISLNPSYDIDKSEVDVIAEATGLRIRNAVD